MKKKVSADSKFHLPRALLDFVNVGAGDMHDILLLATCHSY